MIRIKSDIRGKDRSKLEPEAGFVRRIFVNGRAYNASQKVEQQNRMKKRFLVKGRIEGGRRYWDVYELDGKKQPKVVGSGFIFQEEAISFARDKSLGREAVSLGGNLRGIFQRGSGGLLIQSSTIEKPGESVVKVTNTSHGVVVG